MLATRAGILAIYSCFILSSFSNGAECVNRFIEACRPSDTALSARPSNMSTPSVVGAFVAATSSVAYIDYAAIGRLLKRVVEIDVAVIQQPSRTLLSRLLTVVSSQSPSRRLGFIARILSKNGILQKTLPGKAEL